MQYQFPNAGSSTDTSNKRLEGRRPAQYLLDGASLSDCYLCGGFPDQLHHLSYFPERVVPLCSGCHNRVHSSHSDGSFLVPDSPRPDDYESIRRHQERLESMKERLADGSAYAECVDCGEQFVFADLYPLDESVRTVRKLLSNQPLADLDVRFQCFRCGGDPQ